MNFFAIVWSGTQRKKIRLHVSCCMAVTALAGITLPIVNAGVNAGTISGQLVTEEADYRFSNCLRPSVPIVSVDGQGSYNEAVRRYNQYVEAINAYMTCITDEANSDLEAQIALISNAHRTEVEGVKLESAQSKAYLQALSPEGVRISPIGEQQNFQETLHSQELQQREAGPEEALDQVPILQDFVQQQESDITN